MPMSDIDLESAQNLDKMLRDIFNIKTEQSTKKAKEEQLTLTRSATNATWTQQVAALELQQQMTIAEAQKKVEAQPEKKQHPIAKLLMALVLVPTLTKAETKKHKASEAHTHANTFFQLLGLTPGSTLIDLQGALQSLPPGLRDLPAFKYLLQDLGLAPAASPAYATTYAPPIAQFGPVVAQVREDMSAIAKNADAFLQAAEKSKMNPTLSPQEFSELKPAVDAMKNCINTLMKNILQAGEKLLGEDAQRFNSTVHQTLTAPSPDTQKVLTAMSTLINPALNFVQNNFLKVEEQSGISKFMERFGLLSPKPKPEDAAQEKDSEEKSSAIKPKFPLDTNLTRS